MKKLVILLLCLCMPLTVSACSKPSDNFETTQAPVAPLQDGGDSSDTEEFVSASLPCPVNLTPDAENKYPYMGVTLRIPEKLLVAVLDNIVFMCSEDNVEYTDMGDGSNLPADWHPTPEHTLLHGGALEFCFVPEEIRDRTPHVGMDDPMSYDEYVTWLPETEPMARFEMCRKDEFQERDLEQNGYAQHKKLGETEEYVYYLSWNESGNEQAAELFALLPELASNITVEEPRKVDDQFFGVTTPEVKDIAQVGQFQAATLDRETVDQSIFGDKKLTMINVWTTWCGSCVDEMPELEALSKELDKMDAQIISICSDTADARGQVDEELLELAQQITQKTGVTFPTLIPDKALHDGLLKGAMGYPTTFFVDSQGNMVGEPVLGANSAEDWLKMAQERMAEVAE